MPQIVPHIDLGAQRAELTPPEGLLELAQVKKEKVRIRALLPGSVGEPAPQDATTATGASGAALNGGGPRNDGAKHRPSSPTDESA